jgi:thymidylate kinase
VTANRGFVLALSGIDSGGKSTQRDLLIEELRAGGAAPVRLWTRPGYSPRIRAGKDLLRRILGRKKAGRGRVSTVSGRYPRRASTLGHPLKRWGWLTVALLDLLWVYAVQVRFWRALRRPVICDRYLLDSLVDFRVYFPDDRVEDRLLCRLLRAVSVRPDVAFCLLVPVEESMRRTDARSRHHWESRETLQQRLDQYRALADELGVQVLDGCEPVERIASRMRDGLSEALAGGPRRADVAPSRLGEP